MKHISTEYLAPLQQTSPAVNIQQEHKLGHNYKILPESTEVQTSAKAAV